MPATSWQNWHANGKDMCTARVFFIEQVHILDENKDDMMLEALQSMGKTQEPPANAFEWKDYASSKLLSQMTHESHAETARCPRQPIKEAMEDQDQVQDQTPNW